MKILVVDDSKAMRMIVKRTLKEAGFGDHTLAEAGSGVEGLAALRREPFDVVLCDWNMPEMNGLEMLQGMKAEKIEVRFGFITSEGTQATRDLATSAGAEFLIAKPFTKEDFQAVLSAVLKAA